MMKYPYSVKTGGVWYPPNTEIPEGRPETVKNTEAKVEKPDKSKK